MHFFRQKEKKKKRRRHFLEFKGIQYIPRVARKCRKPDGQDDSAIIINRTVPILFRFQYKPSFLLVNKVQLFLGLYRHMYERFYEILL